MRIETFSAHKHNDAIKCAFLIEHSRPTVDKNNAFEREINLNKDSAVFRFFYQFEF